MQFLITSFLLSLIGTFLLITHQKLHGKSSYDSDLSGPQKFHTQIVPRIGGIGIFMSILITGLIATIFHVSNMGMLLLQIMACGLPVFLTGLMEDLTKRIDIKTRFISALISAGLAGYFLNVWIVQLHISMFDDFLTISSISITLTLLAISGLINSYNIIDGFNGLASMVAIICLLAIGYIAFKNNDFVLAYACLIVLGAIAGFFVWNYPRGSIFLGDGGAYIIGFLIATLSILLIKRNPIVSPWFALLVNAYPIFETLFTIWRRKIYQGKNPTLPDGTHFHSLVYRRVIRWARIHEVNKTLHYEKNAKTSPFIWLISCSAVIPSIIWWDNSQVLQFFALLFCTFYVWIYRSVVKFKTPKFIKIFR